MFGRSSKRTATPGEVEVASAILSAPGDPRAALLLEQFAAPRCLLRRVDGPRLQLTSDPATSGRRADLPGQLRSAPVVVRDETTQVALTFSLLVEDGVVRELVGVAERGAWPALWSVEPAELAAAAEGALRLPPA